MNLFTGIAANEFFGGAVPAALQETLHRAASAAPDERTALLWSAQSCAPDCLAIYYALYKHHAGRREFELADRAARRGLLEAGRQCGLPGEVEAALQLTAAPAGVDFQSTGPARFWLFTMKALAFIALRGGAPEQARERLALIDRLDPQARLGTDVTAALLASATAAAAAPSVEQPAEPAVESPVEAPVEAPPESARITAPMLSVIQQSGEAVLVLSDGLEQAELLRSRLTRAEVRRQLCLLADTLTALPAPVQQTLAEIDWGAWRATRNALDQPGSAQDEALWFAVRSLVPAALSWLPIYRRSHPELFDWSDLGQPTR